MRKCQRILRKGTKKKWSNEFDELMLSTGTDYALSLMMMMMMSLILPLWSCFFASFFVCMYIGGCRRIFLWEGWRGWGCSAAGCCLLTVRLADHLLVAISKEREGGKGRENEGQQPRSKQTKKV